MAFNFNSILSDNASARSAPFEGYPPYHFVGGNIDEPSVPVANLIQALETVLHRDGHSMAKYGMESGPQGYLPLRQFICSNLRQRTQIDINTDEVLLTSGSLQAMDLVNKALLNQGDSVILEAANYSGAISKLRALNVEPIPVAVDENGMMMDQLRNALLSLHAHNQMPKYIYTIPTIQNPTGSVMPVERRLEMLEIAREFEIPIFEDDCYADLVFSGIRPPALKALDENKQVIYCATFSKTIAPALRVGYLVAPWPLMGHILPLKTDAGSGALEQMVLAEYLPKHFDDHVNTLLPILSAKADALCESLDEHFGASAEYDRPVGGIYLWVTLPESVNTDQLFASAVLEGIEINQGSSWTVIGSENQHKMRLCFGHPSIENIKEGIAKLADVCHREFGIPERGGNLQR